MTDENPKKDALNPVLTPDHLEASKPQFRGDFYSRFICVVSASLIVLSLIMSAVAFAGFAENDFNLPHLISAFLLCFGVGALAYGPLTLIFYYAKQAITAPMPKFRVFVVIALILPWFVLGFYLARLQDWVAAGGIVGIVTSLLIGVWALRYLR